MWDAQNSTNVGLPPPGLDVKLVMVREGTSPGTGVTGWLRNISGRTITQCVVACVFQDLRERQTDVRRSPALDLPYDIMLEVSGW